MRGSVVPNGVHTPAASVRIAKTPTSVPASTESSPVPGTNSRLTMLWAPSVKRLPVTSLNVAPVSVVRHTRVSSMT